MKSRYPPLQVVVLPALAAMLTTSCAPATGETDALLSFALESRVAAQDIPDFGLLPSEGPIRVLLAGEFGKGRDLPTVEGRPLISVTLEELRDLARSTSTSVSFVSVGAPQQDGNVWVLDMGVDLMSPEPDTPKECCCSGPAMFVGEGGGVRFLRWGEVVCS